MFGVYRSRMNGVARIGSTQSISTPKLNDIVHMQISFHHSSHFVLNYHNMSTSPETSNISPVSLVSTLLSTVEDRIVPLTSKGVSSGSKVFGAAILSNSDLTLLTVATNHESLSPLLHGEINCIQQFFTVDFPDPATRPSPRMDCIFFATHEPCSLCLSGIAWSGFKEVYHLFTYEDSRDLFSIPYDIDILEQVFRVRADNEGDEAFKARSLYNRDNKFFKAKSLADVIASVGDVTEREELTKRLSEAKALYNGLSQTYQSGKQGGTETASVWK
jgi:tRNA(Arg) A34 adenosine deaminase TadA